MIITHKIDMHLDMLEQIPWIKAVQGDAWTRIVQFNLLCEGLPWEIPDGSRAVVRFLKPDGCGGEYETLPDGTSAYTISGNTVAVVLAPEVLTAEGLVMLTVSLIDADTEISAFQIRIEVHTNTGVRLANSVNYYRSPWLEEMLGNRDQDISELRAEITQLQAEVADLQYVPIDITSISNSVGTVELGSTVDTVTITWAVNREPVSQTVEGEAVEADDRSAVVPGPFTETTSFEVVATDERGATDTATTRINFYNGIYYGPLASGVVPDSADILGLTRKLQSGKGATISYTPTDGKRPSYACPTSYGTPKFVIGGFEYAWTRLGTIQFENASGHKETYGVWQHPQDVTAAMTITVS